MFVVEDGSLASLPAHPWKPLGQPKSLEHRRGALFEANVVIYEGLWPKKASNGGSLKKGLFEGRFWHPFRVKTPNLEPSNALGYIILGPFTALNVRGFWICMSSPLYGGCGGGGEGGSEFHVIVNT